MGFLDFIKERGQRPSAEQQSQQQKPETAKEMNTREAAQERPAQKSVAQISDADKSYARELGSRIDQAAQDIQQKAPAQTQAPEDGTGSPEPMRQNMMSQDKAAPALSPTSAQQGKTSNEQDGPAPSEDASSKSQESSQEQTRQTIARRPPSWER